MRAWNLAAVMLLMLGCNKESGAPAASQVPPETSVNSAPPRPALAVPIAVYVVPRELWVAYSENEVAADMKFRGKTVELVGLVQDIMKDAADNIVVKMDVGELLHGVLCRFPDEQAQAVSELTKGQLVSLQGEVHGLVLKSPLVKDCRVAWSGPRAKDKIDDNVARLTARGAEACSMHIMLRMEAPGGRMRDGGVVTEEMMTAALEGADPRFTGMIARARAELADAGVSDTRCDHPTLPLPLVCEVYDDEVNRVGPECKTPFVKAVMRHMQR